MLTMLQGWKGDVEINGEKVSDISAYSPVEGQIHIKLLPKRKNANLTRNSKDLSTNTDKTLYKIKVRQYMTRKSTPDFDFMAKWNNDMPMPLQTMTGWVEKETPGMYYMHLKGKAERTVTCMRCGRHLTNPVSKKYGIGPECLCKIGFAGVIEDVEGASNKLEEIEWTGWVIKKAIESQEEV